MPTNRRSQRVRVHVIDEARGNRLRFEYLTRKLFERYQRSILIDGLGLIATTLVVVFVAAESHDAWPAAAIVVLGVVAAGVGGWWWLADADASAAFEVLMDHSAREGDPVEPHEGGMSVTFGDPGRLPIHRRPAAFGGTGNDPVYGIDADDLGPDLVWRADPNGPSGHGFLEPVRRMPFNEYQQALWRTRDRWRRVDP